MLTHVRRQIQIENSRGEEMHSQKRSPDPYGLVWQTTERGAASSIAHTSAVATHTSTAADAHHDKAATATPVASTTHSPYRLRISSSTTTQASTIVHKSPAAYPCPSTTAPSRPSTEGAG